MKFLAVLLFVVFTSAQDHGYTLFQKQAYHQFLRASHPNQLKYTQLLGADLYGTMIQTPLHNSEMHVTYDGADTPAYSWLTKILPDHSHSGFTKQTHNDRHLFINHAGPVEVRMITEGGTTKVELLGDPIATPGAHFDVLVPHNVYAAISNLGDHAAVVTAASAPAWKQDSFSTVTEADMDAKFPSLHDFISHGYHD